MQSASQCREKWKHSWNVAPQKGNRKKRLFDRVEPVWSWLFCFLYVIVSLGLSNGKLGSPSVAKASHERVTLRSLVILILRAGWISTYFCRSNKFFRCCGIFTVHTPVARGTSVFHLIRRTRHWAPHPETQERGEMVTGRTWIRTHTSRFQVQCLNHSATSPL